MSRETGAAGPRTKENGSLQEETRRPDVWNPPWIFRHPQVFRSLENARTFTQRRLVDLLNHVHFIGGHVFLHVGHGDGEDFLLKAAPQPCTGEKLICKWAEESISTFSSDSLNLRYLLIDEGLSMLVAPATLEEMTNESVTLQLPAKAFELRLREFMRRPCRGVSAEVNQHGFVGRGRLLDFSPKAFRIRFRPDSGCSFHWLNPDESMTLTLRNSRRIILTQDCRCLREDNGSPEREMVLLPLGESFRRFKKRRARNPRQHLRPLPMLHFIHPLLGKKMSLQVSDISTSGFSVHEKAESGVLVPGMIISGLTIAFGAGLKLQCACQVVYRIGPEEGEVRCGLTILEMDVNSYTQLADLLGNALERHTYVSGDIDPGELWEFFFESGFIYPRKYGLLVDHKELFKETYRKLYQRSPEIAKHFTYREYGQIYGHIALVRAYNRSWLIQHHSSRPFDGKRAGFTVLKQIIHFLNGMYRLPSLEMKYVMTYFRPENRIPDRIFGGFAKAMGNPTQSCVDLFAYLLYPKFSISSRLPEGWVLRESTESDLWFLNRFYQRTSGGLLLDALGLSEEERQGWASLKKIYQRNGFVREIKAFSLIRDGQVQAILVKNSSDLGFNLSELLNGLKVLVTEPQELSWSALSAAIARLISSYPLEKVPVMLFPASYALSEEVPSEKKYYLWILNVNYGDQYMEYMQEKFRI